MSDPALQPGFWPDHDAANFPDPMARAIQMPMGDLRKWANGVLNGYRNVICVDQTDMTKEERRQVIAIVDAIRARRARKEDPARFSEVAA